MSPGSSPIWSITASQASMHWVQAMHSICRPSRMSMPGRAGADAEAAVDAVAGGSVLPSCATAPRLAALRVVADDQRLPVEQHRLEAAVGAGHDAGLLAEVAEVEEHQQGRADHDRERRRVLERRTGHPAEQAVPTDEVGEEGVGEEGGDDEEDRVLEDPPRVGPRSRRGPICCLRPPSNRRSIGR